jgi:tight adherence protein B
VIEGLAALVAALAAGLLAHAAGLAMNRAVKRQRERYVEESLTRREAVLYLTANQRIVISLACAFCVGVVGWVVMGLAAGVLMGFCALFAPGIYIKMLATKRLALFNEQLVDSLNALSSAFRAGLSFAQAIEAIAEEAEDPLGNEFRIAAREMRMGVDIPDALEHISQRTGSDDMGLVATSTAVAAGMGGNMAEMFETISRTIADRFRIEGRIAALTSMGRMQGIVVALLPFVLAIALNWMRPDLMGPMMAHPFGWALIAAILTLDLIGALIIKQIVEIDV